MRAAIIPARGGSVRVPRKCIREFRGIPMLMYPLVTAAESKLFDLTVVSTDDEEVARLAFLFGAIVVPREADDGSMGTQELAARVLDQLDAHGDYCCVLYPCTPLLDVDNLKRGLEFLRGPAAKAFARSVGPDGQDAGCFYFGWTRAFRARISLDEHNTIDVPLPAERVCDVNTPEDWAKCETMFDALRRVS